MEFSLAVQNYGRGTSPATLDASGEAAESLGWRTLYLIDHPMVPRSGEPEYHETLEPLTSLAYLAGRFGRVRLATGVLVPPMRDAVLLAKELATLDLLSGGRLIVGVGVGNQLDHGEYQNLGKEDRFGVRGAYLDETIALWRRLWAGSEAPFEGRFHLVRDFTFGPLPPQGARMPIYAGGRSERALDRVSRLCDGLYSSRWGPTELRRRWPPVVERARANGRPRPALATRVRVRIGAPPDDRYSVCGTAREMVAQLLEFEELGTDEFVAVLPATEAADVRREAERFAREVIAPFREELAERRQLRRDEYSM